MLKDDNLLAAFHRSSPESNNDVPGDIIISIESQIPAKYKDVAEKEERRKKNRVEGS